MNDEQLKEMYNSAKTVAVVGLSKNTARAAHGVAKSLQGWGYKIVPVNPGCDEVLGETCYPSLKDIPFPVDVVDVFRASEFAPEIARGAVNIGAKYLWLQDNVESAEAREIAEKAGIMFIENNCIFRERIRLFGFS